jgi:hypothetical protein
LLLPTPISSNLQSGAVRKTAPRFQQKKEAFHRGHGLFRGLKRGRPPRLKPRDSFDSGGSDASSGSLDLFIPVPVDFEGFNNPFRDVDNCLRRIVPKSAKTGDEVIAPPAESRLFGAPKETSLTKIFCSGKLDLAEALTCARRLTLEGEVQYLVEREYPAGPMSPTLD